MASAFEASTAATLPPLLRCPPELLQEILLELEPFDVSSFSQTNRFLHELCQDPFLWKRLFLQYFDATIPGAHQATDFDYRTTLERRFRSRTLIRMAREEDQKDRIIHAYDSVLPTFLDLSATSTSSDSLNILFLNEIFSPSSTAFTAEYIHTYFGSSMLGAVAERDAYHFHLLHGPTWRSFESWRLLKALRLVYDINSYNKAGSFGPYLPADSSGMLKVDWKIVDSLRLVIENNIRDAVREVLWGISPRGVDLVLPGFEGWADSAPGKQMPNPDDWAGVEQDWIGSFSYPDWNVFATFSDPSQQLPPILRPSDFREEVGDLMSLNLKLTIPQSYASAHDPSRSPYPPLTFTGTLASRHGPAGAARAFPSLVIQGLVEHRSVDDSIRWSYDIFYQGSLQWRLQAVQVGGPRSRMGVVGVWSRTIHHFAGLGEGPCGPFHWWPSLD